MQEHTLFNHTQVNSSTTRYPVSSYSWRNKVSDVSSIQAAVYQKKLEAVMVQLDLVVEDLRKNPHAENSLERFKQVVKESEEYLSFAPTEKLRRYQRHLLNQLRTKVEGLKVERLSKTLLTYFPLLLSEGTSITDISVFHLDREDGSNAKRKRSVAGQEVSRFPASFDLTTLDGTNGFVVNGISSNNYLGWSVSTAGDINGDGKADLVLGAYGVSNYAGAAYVIFGQSSFPSSFNLTTLNGTNGFVVNGIWGRDHIGVANNLGGSVSTAGDINGDGKTDLVLGANYRASNTAGAACVIFGQSHFPSSFNLTTLNGTNGFVVNGISNVLSQGSVRVSTAGDINGDGKADLVLGIYGVYMRGAAYVIFGQSSSFPSSFNLVTLNGTNGFVVNGISLNDNLGVSVSTAGDINGDGKADLVLGANGVSNVAGAAYVIFGQSSFPSSFTVATLNGTNGFVVNGISSGISTGDRLGSSVSTAGDINGDGKADLVLGAWGGPNFAGAAYVIFGQSSFPPAFNLTTLNGTNGFVVNGIWSGDQLGYSVSTAGDINGDGKADLVLGAWRVSGSAGAAYVIFGQSHFPSSFNLTTLNGTNGFVVKGISSGDQLGTSVSTAGDINGDGKTDLVLGAYGVSGYTGAAYVIFQVNTAPVVINPIPNQTVTVNQPFNFTVLNNTFSDPDGDPLVYSAEQTNGNLLPSWLAFDNKSGFFSGVAPTVETTPLSVLASDPYGLSTRANFSLSVKTDLSSAPNSLGSIVGGVVGGVLGFGALIGLGYGLYKKRGSSSWLSRYQSPSEDTSINTHDEASLTRV